MTNQYGDIDTYFDYISINAKLINSEDNSWFFNEVLDFMDNIKGYIEDKDDTELQLNQQFEFEQGEMQPFIDIKFKGICKQTRREFVGRIFGYYEDQFDNNGQIKDLTVNINRDTTGYDCIISIRPYIVEPESYNIYYDDEDGEFIAGTEVDCGYLDKATFDNFNFKDMKRDKAKAAAECLNNLFQITEADFEEENQEEVEDDRIKRPDWKPEFK